MSDSRLRRDLIRLAKQKPEFRPHLLPLLKKQAQTGWFLQKTLEDIYYDASRDANWKIAEMKEKVQNQIQSKLNKYLKDLAKGLQRDGFTMDQRNSYIEVTQWTPFKDDMFEEDMAGQVVFWADPAKDVDDAVGELAYLLSVPESSIKFKAGTPVRLTWEV
mgnify:CR=1 FL=1